MRTTPHSGDVDPVSAGDSPGDKRKHTRFDVDAEASIKILGSSAQAVRGQIEDVSQRGLKLIATHPFPVGEILRVEAGGEIFVVVVCHCSKTANGFRIGTEMMHSIKRVHLEALVEEWSV